MPKRTFEGPLVSARFIRPAAKRLGVPVSKLAELAGSNKHTVSGWLGRKQCPLGFKTRVNRLMLDDRAANLPAVIDARQIVDVEAVPVRGARGGRSTITLSVDQDKAPLVRALLAALRLGHEG